MSKIIAPEGLVENISSVFSFLPEIVIIIISTLLPVVEIVLGLMLIAGLYNKKVRSKNGIIQLITMSLFGFFFLYSIYGFIVGRGGGCGCFGSTIKSGFGWEMTIRNLLFLSFSLFLLYYEIIRNKRTKINTNKED